MEQLTGQIIASAIEVHRHLGPGLLESTYEECLAREFELKELPFNRQVTLPVTYKGQSLDCGYRMDFVVNDKIILELKAVEKFEPIHQAQLLTYLKLSNRQLGLLINFNVPLLKQGIKRIANNYQTSASSAPLR
ncbi:MAG: GxxExxY protein [Verrucomicrobiales bacterium]|jgi:GxxExxY protein|nr:GxxExxY protein [Verrucomicrobiales bacterium]